LGIQYIAGILELANERIEGSLDYMNGKNPGMAFILMPLATVLLV